MIKLLKPAQSWRSTEQVCTFNFVLHLDDLNFEENLQPDMSYANYVPGYSVWLVGKVIRKRPPTRQVCKSH